MVTTEITSESWFGRLAKSVVGVLIGLGIFAGSFVVLFWNEGRAVKTEKSLHEGAKAVVSVAADRVDPANNQKLVHVSGRATTSETLTDPEFLVSANAIKLRRRVEMYQWEEKKESKTRKKLGGGTETATTYSYAQTWSEKPIDSSSFKEADAHRNPSSMPYESHTINADHVTLGAFTLTPSLVDQMREYDPVALNEQNQTKGMKLSNNTLYSADPQSPQIGDVRIAFSAINPGDVSVISKQAGTSFEPYHASAGMDIEMLKRGVIGPQQMFETALNENSMFTWILRAVGWFAMFLGLALMFRPLSVAGDVVPFVGSMMAFGTGVFAFVIASVLSTATIGVAWIYYRPLLGISLLAVAIIVLVWFATKAMKRSQVKAAATVRTPSMPTVT
ncbi:MAG TPA: TMEM43 family protein [Thermoanaerobaculia bacterium]|nr:TMEM43 family protein [Thermoanaerobaculia bacterium]